MADEASRRMAHELNNVLQVILGSLELMKRNRVLSPEAVETALAATRRAAALAQRLAGPPDQEKR